MENQPLYVGHLCAFRTQGSLIGGNLASIEILLTRNGFWDNEHNRPRDFAGEWMFPYTSHKRGDGSLANTACRAFRDQLGYEGRFHGLAFVSSYDQLVYDVQYHDAYHAAQLDAHEFILPETSPLIDYRWLSLLAAQELIHSDTFTAEQLQAFKEHGLDDACLGPYALVERQIPYQTGAILSRLSQMPALLYAVSVEKKGL